MSDCFDLEKINEIININYYSLNDTFIEKFRNTKEIVKRKNLNQELEMALALYYLYEEYRDIFGNGEKSEEQCAKIEHLKLKKYQGILNEKLEMVKENYNCEDFLINKFIEKREILLKNWDNINSFLDELKKKYDN